VKRIFGAPAMDYAPPIAVLALTSVYLATAYTYTAESRAFPLTVAWASMVLATLDLISRARTPIGEILVRWLNPAAAPGKADAHPAYPALRQLAAIAWVAAFAAMMIAIGILHAVPVYVFASMYLRGRRSLWLCVAVSAGVTLLIWFLFEQVLQLELYTGILFGAL
jgi:putative tricarboxylic transport membrane protein